MKAKQPKIFSSAVLSDLFAQLSLFQENGVSLYEALDIMGGQSQDAAVRGTLELGLALQGGKTLSRAAGDSGRFPAYAVTMLEVGESSGELDSIIQALSAYYAQRDLLQKQLRSALLYPICMTVMALCVVWVVLVQVMPVFQRVFEQLGVAMDAFSLSLLALGQGLDSYAFAIAMVLLLVILVLLLMRRTARGLRALSAWYERGLFTRKLAHAAAAERFALCMSLMLQSGVDADTALELSGQAVEGELARGRIRRVRELLDAGTGFTEAVSQSGILPGVYRGMLMIAQRTGNTAEILGMIARRCRRDAQELMQSRISVIEPVLVALLCVIVGMVLLSVILPLTGILSSM